MPKAAVYHKKGLVAQDFKAKLKDAVNGIQNGTYKSSCNAAKQLNLNHITIWRHLMGKSASWVDSHAGQQLLTPPQEKVLVNWVKWLGFTGLLSKHTIGLKVEALCGGKPSH